MTIYIESNEELQFSCSKYIKRAIISAELNPLLRMKNILDELSVVCFPGNSLLNTPLNVIVANIVNLDSGCAHLPRGFNLLIGWLPLSLRFVRPRRCVGFVVSHDQTVCCLHHRARITLWIRAIHPFSSTSLTRVNPSVRWCNTTVLFIDTTNQRTSLLHEHYNKEDPENSVAWQCWNDESIF